MQRSDEVGQTQLRLILRLGLLLAQVMQTLSHRMTRLIAIHGDIIIAHRIGGKKPITAFASSHFSLTRRSSMRGGIRI